MQSLETGDRTELLRGGDARLLPPGLLYARGTALFAVPFDVADREVTGTGSECREIQQSDR